MFGRSGQKYQRQITDDEWYLIDRLIQDAIVINRQLGSEEAVKNLQDNCKDQEVMDEIMRLAREQ